MKFLVSALLLSSTISCFGQTAAQHPVDPDQLFQMPKQFQLAQPNFDRAMSYQTLSQAISAPLVISLREAPQLGNPQLDAKIIRRPLQEKFTAQQPRSPLAADLYPNLKLLPLESARVDADPSE